MSSHHNWLSVLSAAALCRSSNLPMFYGARLLLQYSSRTCLLYARWLRVLQQILEKWPARGSRGGFCRFDRVRASGRYWQETNCQLHPQRYTPRHSSLNGSVLIIKMPWVFNHLTTKRHTLTWVTNDTITIRHTADKRYKRSKRTIMASYEQKQ